MTRACLAASLAVVLTACSPPPPTESGGQGGNVSAAGGGGGAGTASATGGSGGRGSDSGSGGSGASSTGSGGSAGSGSGGATANTGGSNAAGTGGSAAGTGGSGNAGTGGGSNAGGAGGGAGMDAAASDTGTPAVMCAKANLDGFTSWLATNEGKMIPSSGSILVRDGAGWAGNVEFVGTEWHVLEILVGNTFNTQRDFSMAKGFTLTYAATTDIYIQARPANAYSGGAKHVIKLPATNGAKTTTFFSFSPDAWTTIGELGRPNYPLGDALKQLRAFVVVGKTPNKISFYGLTVDGYRPTCP